jgi:alpha-amylase/alpha-mannosidase (GH57 family)
MASQPLRVAILWHQHQPYYKHGNSYLLPWARLHATKDYYDIAAALERFPKVRQTINVVPSLLVQLIDYVENGASDMVLDLSRRGASELKPDEKITILRYFFLCNTERMILPYPRYADLYARGCRSRDDVPALEAASATFTTHDWLDLQVWYNLTWIGEYSRDEEPFKSLLAKGQGFTEDEKRALLDASLAIVAKVIPTYRRLMESGQVELSVTPFYHPILPILCDSYTALEAMPNAELPTHHINYPDDASVHIGRAIELFRERFGAEPHGMWPSEGSVSDQALALVRGAGLRWAATDEGVLRKTLGEGWSPLAKYFPYTLKSRSGPLWMVFRDHELSDAIGFVYSNWEPESAALDFYNRLIEIRSRIIQEGGGGRLAEAIVPVILDGENCWEYYIHNGRPFLEALYRLISESNELAATTIWEALADAPTRSERTIGRIYAGSWIGSNFKIWIGHEEDNRAWDALATAREKLMASRDGLDAATFARAMEEIYIAEGSDWFWWFGDENSSANQDDFDDLFRAHLREVYTLIGEEPPASLDEPIRRAGRRTAVHPPSGAITPTIDGLRSSNEWADAGHFVVEQIGGAMHHADAFERRVWFGSDAANFYLRFDTPLPLASGTEIRLTLHGRRSVMLGFTPSSVEMAATIDESGRAVISGLAAAIGETLEAAIPLSHLDGEGVPPESIGIVCEIFENGHQTERFPHQGEVVCPLAAGTS